jgi:hypothetical protein
MQTYRDVSAPAGTRAKPTDARPKLTRLALAVLAACPLVVWGATRLVYALSYQDSDFFTFWLAARMQWTGQDPYSAEQWLAGHHQFGAGWIPNAIYPYPLPLAALQAPLGWLPLDRAYITWVSLTAVLLMMAVALLLLRDWQPHLRHFVFPLLAGVALFRPAWVTLRNGQLGGLLLFVAVLAACRWEQRRWVAGGALLGLLALKPTIGFPVLGLAGLWLLARREWRAMLGVGLTGIGLVLIAQLQNPNWLARFLSVGQAKLGETFGYSPTLWGVAGSVCGHAPGCTVGLGAALAAGLVALSAWMLAARRDRLSPLEVLGLSLPTALLVMPYGWAYDQVLLVLPLTLATLALARSRAPYLVSALLFFAVDVLAIGLLLLAARTGEDTWSALVPLAAWGLMVWVARPNPSARSATVPDREGGAPSRRGLSGWKRH